MTRQAYGVRLKQRKLVLTTKINYIVILLFVKYFYDKF
nr:MAG TPA: hypothetical protein [Caudoviricetes sp.]